MNEAGIVSAISGVVTIIISLGTIIGLLRGLPWLLSFAIDRGKLIAKIEYLERENDNLSTANERATKALEAISMAHDGVQAMLESLAGQIAEQKTYLDQIKQEMGLIRRKFALSVQYIRTLLGYHEQYRGEKDVPLPEPPPELQDDLNITPEGNKE